MLHQQRQLQQARLMDRKQDAHKKIQLGSLLIKAGFGEMHPHEAYVIYGMLLDCQRTLQQQPDIKNRWKLLGKALLTSSSKFK